MTKKEQKTLTEYRQSKPSQLEMFELDDPQMDQYSNTVELYDVMPKFYFGGAKREKGKLVDSLPILKREFKYRQKDFSLKVLPAAIEDDSGKTIYYYPGQREELVEDVIRKLATKKKGIFLDNELAVKFSLYEVAQELKRMGHGYNIAEIKDAIQICNKSIIEVKSNDGNEISVSSSIFQSVFMENKEEETGKNRVVVMLHPLITKSINEGSYRLINYERLMKLKMPLARWLHRRISHLFSQATVQNPYKIKLSTIIRDSGMKAYKTTSERIRQVVKSIKELESVGTILKFEEQRTVEKNKIVDVVFEIYVSESFVYDIKKANRVANIRGERDRRVIEQKLDLEGLKVKLSKAESGLTNTVVNNIVQNVRTMDEYNAILSSYDAALAYIEQLKLQGRDFSAGAVVNKAIKEKWIVASGDSNEDSKKKLEVKIEKSRKNSEKKDKERLERVKDFADEWKKTSKLIEKTIGKGDFDKWFRDVEFYDLKDGKIILSTTKFQRDWISREFMGDIERVLKREIGFFTNDN